MPEHGLDLWLALACVTLLAAVIGVRLSARAGLPSMLIYLALGLLIGESGLGVEFSDADLTRDLGLVALAVILAEGGLTTRWRDIKPSLGFSIVMATLGVAISVAVVAAASYWILDFDLRIALLVGAVVSSTDAAAVFSVLRAIPLPKSMVAPLEAESGFNDAPVVILVTVLASDSWDSSGPGGVLGVIALELFLGALVGVAFGWLGAQFLARISLPAAGVYPLATVTLILLAFSSAGLLHASGFLAAYITGVWLGNSRLPHQRTTLAFAEGIAWLAQIGLFVLLGLLASPSRLPDALVPALVAGFVLTFFARPLSVAVSALAFRYGWREQAFLSWAGLRGAVPIVLATIPLSEQIPGSTQVFDIVFVLVVVYTLIQGPTLPMVAKRLQLTETMTSHDLSVDAAPLDEMKAELLQFSVPEGSSLRGVTIEELRLPAAATVSLVVRDGRSTMPTSEMRLRAFDQILIVCASSTREAVEERLEAVNTGGRLADWVGEESPAARPTRWWGRRARAARQRRID